MRTHSDYNLRPRGHRVHEPRHCALDEPEREPEFEREADALSDGFEAPEFVPDRGPRSHGHSAEHAHGHVHSPHERTDEFVSHGRLSARRAALPSWRAAAFGGAILAVLITILVLVLSSGGPSWPASVAVVQNQADRACQNPDVASEPTQVNFACARSTRQILWVFSLLMSGDNPSFADAKTGRMGLEPITPSQGGQVAWSLNLHHPYNATNPVDSLAVAARAINNIIGGATLTGSNGTPVVQAGLEASRANCVRYTGSAAQVSRQGFPSLCAKPVTTVAGQAALVADVYLKWVVGASPQAAQNAAVLFENANNPGDPEVQAILARLPGAKPAV